jgi:hypothetical protein
MKSMNASISFWGTARVAAILVLLMVSVFGPSSALAAGDRTPPTKPTNLRVTSTSAYYVNLAWNPSTDNSGTFSYKVWVSYNQTYTVSQTQTTFSLFVAPNSTYSFYVYAVDGSGNKSARSNTVSARTLRDTTAPSAPVVSVAGVNPSEISLNWTASTDDGPYLFYQVFVNGSLNVDAGQKRFAVVKGLTPETSYVITVKARDLYGPNTSAPSNAVNATTAAVSTVDTQPPSAPGNLHGGDMGDGAREINLYWDESFDNQTAQASIAYEIYQNGVLDHTTGGGRAILYATSAGANTFTVIAVDDAGNRSEAASITIVSQ